MVSKHYYWPPDIGLRTDFLTAIFMLNETEKKNEVDTKVSPQELEFTNTKAYSLIFILGGILYFKSLFFGFSYLDDNALILNNLSFLQNIGNIFTAFTQEVFYASHSSAAYFRPILTISFMPEAILGGVSPFLYHLTNVIIHLIAASLVFKLLTKLNYSRIVSLFLSVIFLVHPALTQAVAWIPGRNDSILTVFVLASFIFFLNFINSKKSMSAVWSGIFFGLAIFTKETALVLPVIFILYLWVRGFLERDILIKIGVGWVLALVVWLPLRHFALLQNSIHLSFYDTIVSFFQNLPVIVQIFGKAVVPFNLSTMPIIEDTTFLWGLLALLIFAIFSMFQAYDPKTSKRNFHIMLFGVTWFFMFLFPTFIKTDPSSVSYFIDHRLYLPIVGLLIVIAESNLGRFTEINNRIHLAVWLSIILVFLGTTFMYENNFSGRLAFWENASKNSPHLPLAQKNMGAMYHLDGQYDSALLYYEKALALNPLETMIHSNIGLIYANQELYDKAEAEYIKELSFNPSYDGAHYNLGLLYFKTEHFELAKKEFEKTLQINPDYTDAKQALTVLGSTLK